ncbi:MAG TPA: hypothetical protein VGM39_23525 [Kofleriaceae bacterium]|jgi:hypothetical protein
MTRFASVLVLAVAALSACATPSQTHVEQPHQSGDSYWLCHDSRFRCEPADFQAPADKIVPDQGIQIDTNLWTPSHRANVG